MQEDPDVPKRGKGRASTTVCNHIGQIEILSQIVSPLHPSFTPKIEIKKIAFINKLVDALQSLYMKRAGTDAEKDALVEQIVQR